MTRKLALLAVAAAAALAGQTVLAQTAQKSREEVKAEAKTAAKKSECGEAATMPAAKSDKARADVKAEAKGATTECEPGPAPKSTAKRADVKEETKKAVKAGEIPQGEAMEKAKK